MKITKEALLGENTHQIISFSKCMAPKHQILGKVLLLQYLQIAWRRKKEERSAVICYQYK